MRIAESELLNESQVIFTVISKFENFQVLLIYF